MNFKDQFNKAPVAKVNTEITNELSPEITLKIEKSKTLISEVGAKAEAITNDPYKNSEKDEKIKLNWKKIKNWSLIAIGAIAAGTAFSTIDDKGALTNAMELATHLPAGILSLGLMLKGVADIILQSEKENKQKNTQESSFA